MRVQNKKKQCLFYLEEHIACGNYLDGDKALFEVIKLDKGKLFMRESVESSALVFLLSGSISISTNNVVNQKIEAGHLFLVTAGDSFYGRTHTDVTLFRCYFSPDIAMCNKFALKNLKIYLPDKNVDVNSDMALLVIHPLLKKEIELTAASMAKGLLCAHFQRIKLDIIFMELRGLYKKEDLARMFNPLISPDDDFKSRVLEIYSKVSTAKELIGEMNMSPATFKRKFQNAFDISPKQWLIQKKKEKLFRDIVMTDMPIAEIADKYNFSVNYVTSFCKKYIGKTPTELRQEYSPQQ